MVDFFAVNLAGIVVGSVLAGARDVVLAAVLEEDVARAVATNLALVLEAVVFAQSVDIVSRIRQVFAVSTQPAPSAGQR